MIVFSYSDFICLNCVFLNSRTKLTDNWYLNAKKCLNSQGTEIFPFSYFAFSMLKLIKVMKDIKNINTFEETRTGGLDLHFSPKGKNGVQNAICAPGVNI